MDVEHESKKFWRVARLLAVVLCGAMLIRMFFFATFVIPSQSMMPGLLTGDIFFATKWSYGWSRYSFSSRYPLFEGRILGEEPQIGDVVIFSGVRDPKTTYIKRVMGLPGDVVAMRRGKFVLNGRELLQSPPTEFNLPITPNLICLSIPGLIDLRRLTADAKPGCSFNQAYERLPNGKVHKVLDFAIARSDNFGPVRVPDGYVFMMGDNRDDSIDSRIPVSMGGLGMVPMDRITGKARYIVFSSNGTGSLLRPWTWQEAFRPERIGPIR